MGTTLVLIGVACVIAAIVGGGVKLSTLEVGTVASIWRQSLLGVFGAILCLAGVLANRSDEGGSHVLNNSEAEAELNSTAGHPDGSNTNAPGSDTNTTDSDATATTRDTKGSKADDAPQLPANPDVSARKAKASVDRQEQTQSGDRETPSRAPLETRKVVIENQCPVPIEVSMAVFNGSSWISYGRARWKINSNNIRPLSAPNNVDDIRAASREFYWKVFAGEQVNAQGGDESKGGLEGVRQAFFAVDGDGNYRLTVHC